MKTIGELTHKNVRLITMGIILVLSLICFKKIVDNVFFDPKISDSEILVLDKGILKVFYENRSLELTQSMTDFTALGSLSVIALLSVVMIIYLMIHKDWSGLSYLLFILTGSSIIPGILKNIFIRERPDLLSRLIDVKSYSFPSGHAFSATVFYLAMAYLISRKITNRKNEVVYYLIAFLIIFLVGISRLYLGVHYPSDVLAGIFLGVAWFITVSIPFIFVAKSRLNDNDS